MKSLNWKRTRLIVLSNLVFKVKDNSRIFFLVAIVTTGAICAVGAIASLSTVAEEEVENQPFAFTYVTGNIYDVLGSIGISGMSDGRRDLDIAMLQNNLEQEGLEYEFYSMPIKGVKSSTSDQPVALFSNQNYNEAMEVIGGESVYLQGEEAILIPPLVGLLASFNELRMGEQLQFEGSVESWTVVDVVKPLVPDNLLGRNLIVLPNESYEQIEASLNLQFDGFYVPEWRQVEGLDNNLRSEKRLYANVADRYAERMELYSTMVLIAILTGIVFFLTAGSFLYFRLYTDLSTDKKRFDVLGKLGLKEKELKRIVSIETGVLFFMPFVVAGIHSIFAFWALQSMYTLSINRSIAMVLIIFTVAQLLYYWLMKRHYMNRLLSMIGK
ncbi:FtsX-like permease family protein [Bacillus sp. JCM 19041]|uniref:FtsX-like permease family protein n=1 Tax=Bacillus sp. JCM 19041 TaxID=1460637 RepID=UPI0006D1028A